MAAAGVRGTAAAHTHPRAEEFCRVLSVGAAYAPPQWQECATIPPGPGYCAPVHRPDGKRSPRLMSRSASL